jgi:hypothetical protein
MMSLWLNTCICGWAIFLLLWLKKLYIVYPPCLELTAMLLRLKLNKYSFTGVRLLSAMLLLLWRVFVSMVICGLGLLAYSLLKDVKFPFIA